MKWLDWLYNIKQTHILVRDRNWETSLQIHCHLALNCISYVYSAFRFRYKINTKIISEKSYRKARELLMETYKYKGDMNNIKMYIYIYTWHDILQMQNQLSYSKSCIKWKSRQQMWWSLSDVTKCRLKAVHTFSHYFQRLFSAQQSDNPRLSSGRYIQGLLCSKR